MKVFLLYPDNKTGHGYAAVTLDKEQTTAVMEKHMGIVECFCHDKKPSVLLCWNRTERWHILGGREIDGEKSCIHLGFNPGVTRKELFDRQDLQGI